MAEVDFDFAESADGMEAAALGGNELHVFEEHGDDWQASFLGDVVEAGLAGADAKAIAASAFGENDEMKFMCGATEVLKFANAAWIEFASVEEEANTAA